MRLIGTDPRLRDPGAVFTPRGQQVTEMYVPRAGLEENLSRALNGNKHIVIHGESGCGKSWLYKKVFEKENVHYCTVNLGGVDIAGTVKTLLETTLARYQSESQVGFSESKAAGLNVGVAEGGLTHEKEFVIRQPDVFENLLSQMRKSAKSRKAVIVFENMEHILSNTHHLNELKGLLLLVDDDNYSKYHIRIVIVTTASNFRTYLAAIDRANTVTNRVHELPEVGRLPTRLASEFIERGLFRLLGIQPGSDVDGREAVVRWITWYSDRVPQYLHELCLEIAYASDNAGRVVTEDILKRATLDWLRASLVSEMTVVESNLNSIATLHGRKNQVIFALGFCNEEEFEHAHIEKIMRKEFPDSCKNKAINVSQILSDLASSKMPLVRRVPHVTGYRFVDPKYRILVRWKLIREENSETLVLRSFDRAIEL